MKVTMIGASGFVGTRLLDLLRAEPLKYECRNIDLQPSHFFDDVTTIGDVRNQEQMDRERSCHGEERRKTHCLFLVGGSIRIEQEQP